MPTDKQIEAAAQAIYFAKDQYDVHEIARRAVTAAEQAEPAPAAPCKHPVWGQDNDGTRVCAKCGLVEHPANQSGAVKVLQDEAGYYEQHDGQLDGIPFPYVAHICRVMLHRILSALDPAEPATDVHPDDLAVDRFAAAMKAKLTKKRSEGRGGWDNPDECSIEYLSYLLVQHLWKGDPIDIGNLAMMIQQRGARIVIDDETRGIVPATDAEPRAWLCKDIIMGDERVTLDGKFASYREKHGDWEITPLFTSPQPESRLREALEESLALLGNSLKDYSLSPLGHGRHKHKVAEFLKETRAALAQEAGR